MGLVANDREFELLFDEAAGFMLGRPLRDLFVMVLVYSTVVDPNAIWIRFRSSLCDDLQHRIERDGQINTIPPGFENPHFDYGLFLIARSLAGYGKTLQDFSLPEPQLQWDRSHGNPLIYEQYAYNRVEQREKAESLISRFNTGQLAAFQDIVSRFDTNPQDCYTFLHGPAGTGKTFLYSGLISHFRSTGRIVLCVASSGIAALLLDGGRTAHSRFKIPIDINPDSFYNFTKNNQVGQLMREADVIIWDEVPIQHRHCFEAVDRHLRDIRNCDKPFGGIVVILGGDFAQILPVIKHGSRANIVLACLRKSPL